jgi:hypothetical protein
MNKGLILSIGWLIFAKLWFSLAIVSMFSYGDYEKATTFMLLALYCVLFLLYCKPLSNDESDQP